jgi:uncharacterized DUF497 family protein
MDVEFDPDKAAENLRKHRVTSRTRNRLLEIWLV